MGSFESDIVKVEPRQTVVLSGYPDEGESEWHVNKAIQLGTPGEMTIAIVLQAADASQHWIATTLDETDDGWTLDKLTGMEGEKPSSVSPEEHGEDIDPDSLDVVEIRGP